MVDNIKLFVQNKQKFESYISNNTLSDLTSKINYLTGEILEYPKKGKDLNLEINITKSQSTILGSVHKYYNLLLDNGNQNFNDFSFCQVKEVIESLIKKYNIENNTIITNLEFGFNLEVSKDPKLIIDKNVLMNNYKSPNKNLKFLGKGDYKEFQLTDYSIKIYSKSKQFKLENNILRVEIKITKKRLLQQLGINSLEDLLYCWSYEKLFTFFREKFEGLNIVDDFDSNSIPENDYNKIIKYTNPNFWIRLKDKKSAKVIYRLKKDFKYLLSKYNLLKTKKEIEDKLGSKFIELLNPNCSDLESKKIS